MVGAGSVPRRFDRKVDAERWLTSQTARRDRGDWIDPRQAETVFAEVAEAWIKSRRDVAASTLARDRSVLDSLIVPYLGVSSCVTSPPKSSTAGCIISMR